MDCKIQTSKPLLINKWGDYFLYSNYCVDSKTLFNENYIRSIDKVKCQDGIVNGYYGKIKKDTYIIYAHDGKLYLDIGEICFDLCEKVQCKYSRLLFIEIFRMRQEHKHVFKMYNSYELLERQFRDPTFDEIDAENMYFLQWLSNVVTSQKSIDYFISRWKI